MNSKFYLLDGEIDPKEIFASFWSNAILIFFVTLLSIYLSNLHVSNTTKEYRASALFKLDSGDGRNSLNLPSALTGLASFASISTGASSNLESIKERIMGRLFIEKINGLIDLEADNFFNSYNPNVKKPAWKVMIKKLLGISNNNKNEEEIIWSSIIKKYRESIDLKITDAENINIVVKHNNPERAAEIANQIMQSIIEESVEKSKKSQNKKLDYLSLTLAESLYDLEQIQEKIKDFKINNTNIPAKGFSIASLNLELAKDKYMQHQKLLNAVNAMDSLYKSNDINTSSYKSLSKLHPIVDQVEFRRIFGQNEIISAWTWPDKDIVSIVLQTLNDRGARLVSDVDSAKINAEQLAVSVEEYTELTRQASIAEASYTVMMEQVKSNSILAGYNDNNSEIFEYASIPINASAPRRFYILAIGASIGILLGLLLSLGLSIRRDVFYSNASQISAQKANFRKKSKKS